MQKELRHQHIRALKKGSKESFRWIYDQEHAAIYHYCLKLIRQAPLAEEATADVFIKLWEKRSIIDPQQSLTPLLFKISKDIAYNYLKKIASNSRLKKAFLENYPMVDLHSGETVLIENEAIEEIHEVVEAMPNRRRKIFKMRYFEGKDNQAIAQQLNISVNTVRVQLVKARQFLRENHKFINESSLLIFYLFFNEVV